MNEFLKSSAQPVWLNVLMQAVDHGHPELQIPLQHLKPQLRCSYKFYTRSLEYSCFHWHITYNNAPRNTTVTVKNKVSRF